MVGCKSCFTSIDYGYKLRAKSAKIKWSGSTRALRPRPTHARTHVSPRVEPDLFSNAEVTRWLEGDGVVYLALLKIGRFSRSNESGREKPPTTMNRGRDENLEEGLHGERKTGGKKPAGQKLGMVVRSTRSKAITRDEEEKCMATVDKMTVICGVTITRRVQMVTP